MKLLDATIRRPDVIDLLVSAVSLGVGIAILLALKAFGVLSAITAPMLASLLLGSGLAAIGVTVRQAPKAFFAVFGGALAVWSAFMIALST